MNLVVLYSTRHGRTRKVVSRASERLGLPHRVFDVAAPTPPLEPDASLIFITPTYGDEELEDHMEDFVCARDDLAHKRFAICELGNYYGYDFAFGAMPILRRHLLASGGREICEPLSLDSFPRLDWPHLDRWVDRLRESLLNDNRS